MILGKKTFEMLLVKDFITKLKTIGPQVIRKRVELNKVEFQPRLKFTCNVSHSAYLSKT